MIAFLIKELDIRGGTHKQFMKLLDYTERQGESFFIITKKCDFKKTYPDFKKYEEQIRVFPYEKLTKNPLKLLRQMSTLRNMVSSADCVNIHDGGFETLLPALRGKRVVWQVNDLPYCFKYGASANTKITLRRKILKRYLTFCRRYVTEFCVNVTKNAERIKEAFNRDAHVFYCGIEPVGVSRDIEGTFSRFKERKINILSSGVFFPYRNYETQVAVIDNLRKQGIDATLKIIGSTFLNKEYAFKIQSMIDESNLREHITICGQVDEIEFRKLHSEADIFMFINVDQSWGLAVFEAMSCGLPVIVSNSVGATEILTDGNNSIFVNPKDKETILTIVLRLMRDEYLYRQISSNSRQFCAQYTWDNSYCSKIFNLIGDTI